MQCVDLMCNAPVKDQMMSPVLASYRYMFVSRAIILYLLVLVKDNQFDAICESSPNALTSVVVLSSMAAQVIAVMLFCQE